jgi:type VI secretion system protein
VNTSVYQRDLPCAGAQRRLSTSNVLVLIALVAAVFSVGCGVTQKARSMFGGQLPFDVVVAPDANEDSPVAVNLVFVYDKKLLDILLKTPATEWFAKREQFVKDYGDALVVEQWEWVPGQQIDRISVPYRPGARRVVLFADYVTDGDHRATADPQEPFRLVLGSRDFSVEKLQ